MKKKHEYIAMSREEARDNLMRKAVFTPKTENIPIEEAVGRVAAADVRSLNDSPNIHASRMDGIAVHFDDFKDGIPDTSDWKEGHEYVFCNTGIGIPGDYDTVYKIEDVELEDGRPVFSDVPLERGTFITPAGSNMKKGDLIVRKGDRLSPLLLSLLATGGYAEAEVIERPVVAFIPTGNELVPPGEKYRMEKIPTAILS